jgi:hypothetical protein
MNNEFISRFRGRTFSRLQVFISSCLLLLASGFSADVSAQNRIRGRVLDEQGGPVPNIEVLLHRVTTTTGGSTVDSDTSDAAGAFTLVAPPETDSAAIFFVAVREGGELFMGEMMRLPFPDTLEYFVEAGDDPVRLPEPVAPQDRRAGLFVILAGAALVLAVLAFALRRRVPEHRRLLVELANLDDSDKSPAAVRRRKHLYERLKRNA